MGNSTVNKTWKTINWKQAEEYVKRLQLRIVKATQQGKWRLVRRLQYLITHSFYAKALAVKKVISNKGKNTAGIDGVIWKTDYQKKQAIEQLNPNHYSPKAVKRIYIAKFGKKEKRPLGIPCMLDRAMQALYLLALEPVSECTSDSNSYGFRRFKSARDAGEKVFKVLSRQYSAQWILEGDIKGCFDNISHQWLIDNIPLEKNMLRKFLKSGYMEKKKLFPTTLGTAQGGIISPTLANITLDGLEKRIKSKYWSNKKGTIAVRYNKHKINFVRYADDFIVTGDSPEILLEVKNMINEFLKERGLSLSNEKTLITHINQGFDFLGWNFRKYKRYKLIVQPSKKSIKKIKQTLKQVVKVHYSSSQDLLIQNLNLTLRGWANYHSSMCSSEAFGEVNKQLWLYLRHWARRRHPHKSSSWMMKRYWSTLYGVKIFCSKTAILYPIHLTPIVRHTVPCENVNCFLDEKYFRLRKNRLRAVNQKALQNSKAGQLLKLL